MSETRVEELVEEAMNPETFNVLDYIQEQPVAVEEVKIYSDVSRSRKFSKLKQERLKVLEQRREDSKNGKADTLSLADDTDETEFDQEINELVEALEKTALIFELKTVAPKLTKSIEKHYVATAPKDDAIALGEHNRKGNADVLSRAISRVVVAGTGAVDESEWDADKLIALEEELYPEQAQQLIAALYDMVHTGYVFDESLTVDF